MQDERETYWWKFLQTAWIKFLFIQCDIRTKLEASQAYDVISIIYKACWESWIARRVRVSVHPTLPPHFIPVALAPQDFHSEQ